MVSCSTSTPINHIVFFWGGGRIPVVLKKRRSSQGGGGGAHPLHPLPRSALHSLQLHALYCKDLAHNGLIFMYFRSGKKFEIHFATEQVNFSFHLPLLKNYLPHRNTMPYHLKF